MKKLMYVAMGVLLLFGCNTKSETVYENSSSSTSPESLEIEEITPTSASTGINLASSISIIFSTNLSASDTSSSAITLMAGSQVISGVLNISGRVATFTPSANLDTDTTYTATVTDGMRGANGEALASNFSWSFTTGGSALLENEQGSACNVQIAANASGNAVAIWEQTYGTSTSIFASYYILGQGWGAAQLIEQNSNYANNPQVAIDNSGNAIAVWEQFDGTVVSIHANRYVSGTGWGASAVIETGTGAAGKPQIAMDSSGNAVAVWHQFLTSTYNIYAARYVVGTGWGTATLIETLAGAAYDPQIASDSSGNAFAIWRQNDGTYYSIYANRYTAGGAWGTASVIESNTGVASMPQIAMDESSNAIAVWKQYDGTSNSIYYNRYVLSVGWGTAATLESSSLAADTPQIALDSSGNGMAIWSQWTTNGYSQILAGSYTAGGSWSTVSTISSTSGNAFSPQLATGLSGNAAAVWEQGTITSVYFNHYVPGAGWDTASQLESLPGYAFSPQLALDGRGNTFAAWEQEDGLGSTTYSISAKTLD